MAPRNGRKVLGETSLNHMGQRTKKVKVVKPLTEDQCQAIRQAAIPATRHDGRWTDNAADVLACLNVSLEERETQEETSPSRNEVQAVAPVPSLLHSPHADFNLPLHHYDDKQTPASPLQVILIERGGIKKCRTDEAPKNIRALMNRQHNNKVLPSSPQGAKKRARSPTDFSATIPDSWQAAGIASTGLQDLPIISMTLDETQPLRCVFHPSACLIGSFKVLLQGLVEITGSTLKWLQRTPKGSFQQLRVPLENVSCVDILKDPTLSDQYLVVIRTTIKPTKVTFFFPSLSAAQKLKNGVSHI